MTISVRNMLVYWIGAEIQGQLQTGFSLYSFILWQSCAMFSFLWQSPYSCDTLVYLCSESYINPFMSNLFSRKSSSNLFQVTFFNAQKISWSFHGGPHIIHLRHYPEAYSEPCQIWSIRFFVKISERLKAINCFYKKLRLRYLTGFWISLCYKVLWKKNFSEEEVMHYGSLGMTYIFINLQLLPRWMYCFFIY